MQSSVGELGRRYSDQDGNTGQGHEQMSIIQFPWRVEKREHQTLTAGTGLLKYLT